MSHDVPLAEETGGAEKEASLREARNSLIEKAKTESGLDVGTFEEIASSFKSEDNNEGGVSYSFTVRGHEIKQVSHTGKSLDETSDILYLDGIELSKEQTKLLDDKYGKAILGLLNSSMEAARHEVLRVAMDDVLK